MEKHFFNMKVNTIDRNAVKDIKKTNTLFTNKKDIPEGDNIILFEGVFSQKFKKGEKSRNGYKYMQDGWDVSNYAELPIILWQHDDSYGGIGFCKELYINKSGDLSGIFFVDTKTLGEKEAYQVKNGYVTSISTGAITIEDAYEHNETGKLYTRDEAEDEFGWENVWECLWGAKDAILTYVVTKAELIENSLVTIGSNYKATAKQVNSIQDQMKEKAEELKTKQINSQNRDTLIPKNDSMDKKNDTTDVTAPAVEEEVKVDVETPETPEADVETPVSEESEVPTEKIEEEKEENEVEELKDKLTTLTDSFESYKSEMEAKFDSLKVENKISQREENRARVKKIFTDSTATKQNESDVKTPEEFKAKYVQ